MKKNIKVRPKDGRVIPYPMSNVMIPSEGADVPLTSYWQRRLNDGDVEIVKEEKKKKEVKAEKVKASKKSNKKNHSEVLDDSSI